MNPERERPRIQDEGAQLLKLCALRDEEAFSRLYDLYAGLLYGLACRMLGASQDAEDAVQDAFLQAWNQSRAFDSGKGSARAWLALLLRSRCLDRLRRRTTRNGYETAAAAESPTQEDGVMSALEWEQARLRGAVKEALDELPPLQRQVVEEAFYEGLSHGEIAAKTGEPLGTVKTRMRLAARKLTDRLKPFWDER